MAYPEMTASDVVTMLVGEAGVIPGEIIPTTNIYPWLTQANVSAWVFIQQLAALENYVAYADALGLFNFGPMPTPEAGLPPAMTYATPPMGTQLVMGKNLVRLRAVVSAAEQVPAVTVTGLRPDLWPFRSSDPGPPCLRPRRASTPRRSRLWWRASSGPTPFFDASVPFDNEGTAMKLGRVHRRRHRGRPGRDGGRVSGQSRPAGRGEHQRRDGRHAVRRLLRVLRRPSRLRAGQRRLHHLDHRRRLPGPLPLRLELGRPAPNDRIVRPSRDW